MMESITEKQKEELFEKIAFMDQENIRISQKTYEAILFLHVNNKRVGAIHLYPNKKSSIFVQSDKNSNHIGSFTNTQTRKLINLFEIDFKRKPNNLINQLIENLK